MKDKDNKLFIGIVVIVVAVFLGNQLGLFSVIGWPNTLDNYSNVFVLQDMVPGNQITNADLLLPEHTNNFSFTVDYILRTYFDSGVTGNIFVSYEVYNYNTNQYETIHIKDWIIQNYAGDQNSLNMKGEAIYNTGIPEHFWAGAISQGNYNRYYGCLDGMTVDEAKALSPWSEGTSTYNYLCLYPDASLVEHEYNDAADSWWDISYFPRLITLDTNYINNSKVLFRITVNSKTNGMDSIRYSDFDIKLWNISTDLYSYYRFENNTCNEIKLMTYQKVLTDYNTEEECLTANYLNNITIYRIVNNTCELYEIPKGQNLSTDYLSNASCQGNIIVCSSGAEKCSGQVSFNCTNNSWTSRGYVNGKCGYTTTIVNTTNTNNGTNVVSGGASISDACTMEAKECSDGSYVARNSSIGCAFDDCPNVIVTPNWWNDYRYIILTAVFILSIFLWYKFGRKK